MKRRNKFITALSLVVIAAVFIFIQPLQSLAIDALSVFRVRDVRAINITVADIEHFTQVMQQYEPIISQLTGGKDFMSGAGAGDFKDKVGAEDVSALESLFIPLDDPSDFTAFDLKLPRDLRSQTPELMMVEASSQSFTLKNSEINVILSFLGASPLPDWADGAVVAVATPAAVIARYDENVLIATQMPVISDSSAMDALLKSLLSLPFWTDDLSAELSRVDLTSGIAYVPVIEGFGQRTTISGVSGYLYALSDLEMLLGSLDILSPDGAGSHSGGSGSGSSSDAGGAGAGGSALIWANGGVLYILAGTQSGGELTHIARSVR